MQKYFQITVLYTSIFSTSQSLRNDFSSANGKNKMDEVNFNIFVNLFVFYITFSKYIFQ